MDIVAFARLKLHRSPEERLIDECASSLLPLEPSFWFPFPRRPCRISDTRRILVT
jgi:hypothetical protein